MKRKNEEEKCYIEEFRRFKNFNSLEEPPPYNEDEFDELEKEVIDILRHIKPWKSNLFKMYYGIDEYRNMDYKNYREIADNYIHHNGKKMSKMTIFKWIEEVMNNVKIELRLRGYDI